jgi:hypothetical protein
MPELFRGVTVATFKCGVGRTLASYCCYYVILTAS